MAIKVKTYSNTAVCALKNSWRTHRHALRLTSAYFASSNIHRALRMFLTVLAFFLLRWIWRCFCWGARVEVIFFLADFIGHITELLDVVVDFSQYCRRFMIHRICKPGSRLKYNSTVSDPNFWRGSIYPGWFWAFSPTKCFRGTRVSIKYPNSKWSKFFSDVLMVSHSKSHLIQNRIHHISGWT